MVSCFCCIFTERRYAGAVSGPVSVRIFVTWYYIEAAENTVTKSLRHDSLVYIFWNQFNIDLDKHPMRSPQRGGGVNTVRDNFDA